MQRPFLYLSLIVSSVVFLSIIIGACKKEQNTDGLTGLQQELPAGFPSPVYKFNDNPLTKEGFELGRKLFYDGRLSIDNMHPCSSCHQQIAAFGTFEHDRSHGVYNSHTLRNAPVLFNLAWNTNFNWDGRFLSMVDLTADKIHGDTEMDETFEGIRKKLEADKEYRELFKKVFRYPFIRSEDILKALAQFIGYMVSANSKYDQVLKGTNSFTASENRGYQLFKTNCASCHPEPMFTDFSIRNNGLPVDNSLKDYGRMRVTGDRGDSIKFKIPTLRNTGVSSNFMHDGRFNTLFQCINHYRTGIQQSPTLDPLLRNGITLTNAEANDIAEFLRTLTDSTFLGDSRFRQPQ